MNLIVNHSSMWPIYDQIADQVKDQIMHGKLAAGEAFIHTVHGKGSFVAFADQSLMLEEKKKEVEADLEMAIRKGRSCGMSDEEIAQLFQIVLED